MTVPREKSGDALPKLHHKLTLHTESRFKQAVVMRLFEELLEAYLDEIPRWVLASDSLTATEFQAEYAKP